MHGRYDFLCLLVGACLIPGCGDDGDGPFASGDLEGSETSAATAFPDGVETSPPRRRSTATTAESTTTAIVSDASTSEAGEESVVPRFDLEAEPPREDLGGDTLVCSPDLQSVVWASTGRVAVACDVGEGCLDAQCVPACEAATELERALGCEFIVSTPAFYENEIAVQNPDGSPRDGACHALWIANTWGRAAQLSLSLGDVDFDTGMHLWRVDGVGAEAEYVPLPDGRVPPGETALLLLSHRPGVEHAETSLECPRTPAITEDLAPHGSDRNYAFELFSDTPVHVQDVLPFGGAASFLPSASFQYPVSAWGNNYVVVGPASYGSNARAFQWFSITASADETEVAILLNAETLSSDAFEVPIPGTVSTFRLDRAEVLQFMTPADFSGSIVDSNAPVAITAGHTFLAKRSADSSPRGGPRDAAHQQLPHVKLLPGRYVSPGIPTRRGDRRPESAIYRVMAVLDDTLLEFEPPIIEPLRLDQGEVAEFESSAPFVIQSATSSPFSLTQYMAGAMDVTSQVTRDGCFLETEAGICPLGDTDWIHLASPDQFSTQYTFALDPTYGVTSLALIRDRSVAVSAIEFSCGLEVGGWQRIGESSFEFAHVDLYRNGSPSTTGCQSSHHRATSAAPFGLVVWGLDRDASYGFAAAGALQSLNDLQIPAG